MRFFAIDNVALEERCAKLDEDVQFYKTECDMLKKEIEHLRKTRPTVYKSLKLDAEGVWSYYCNEGDAGALKNSPVKKDLKDFLMSAVGEHHVTASQALAIFEEAGELFGIKVKLQPHQSYAAGLFSEGKPFSNIFFFFLMFLILKNLQNIFSW